MMRRHIAIALAAAAAAFGVAQQSPNAGTKVVVAQEPNARDNPKSPAPVGALSETQRAMVRAGWGVGGEFSYRRHRGWSVAEGKRRAARRRNQLRAKGQHRKAVR